jgi:triosephosphate isomerase (TIM)
VTRKPIIAANWKMHNDLAEGAALIEALKQRLAAGGAEVVLCPPFIALASAAERLRGSGIALGAQNMHWADKGAYTGEISPLMLKSLVRYVIIGHSERRQYFGETDETVQRKVRAAIQHRLTPILCVGENLPQYEAGQSAAVVDAQVRAALREVSAQAAATLVIAYEPVWAIGTGKAASGAGANAIIGLTIRGALSDLFGEQVAQSVRVQYGGSVTPSNIKEFMQQPDIDGALVGGASLKVDDFVAIVAAARK